ncbi:MAG: hypothetical protein O2856_12640 [Planctomycetota bacterium]|nr:hypothetical protein [Planctomycetota bacterium]
MARLAPVEVFAADEIAIVHVMNRPVWRCFLLGDEQYTGKNHDHRKLWIDEQLIHQAKHFGIDLLCQAIMSNHFHLVLRSRPDVVAEWDDSEIARRWLKLCPERRDKNGKPEEPSEFELNESDFTSAQKRCCDLWSAVNSSDPLPRPSGTLSPSKGRGNDDGDKAND